MVDFVLRSTSHTCLLWGSEGAIFYNDAWARDYAEINLSMLGKPVTDLSRRLHRRYSVSLAAAETGDRTALSEALTGILWRSLLRQGQGGFSCTPIMGALQVPSGMLIVPCPLARGRETRTDVLLAQNFMLELSDQLRRQENPSAVELMGTRTFGEYVEADRVNYVEFDVNGAVSAVGEEYRRDVNWPPLRDPQEVRDLKAVLDELKSGRVLLVPDLTKEAGPVGAELEGLSAGPVMAQLTVPVMRAERLVAQMTVRFRNVHRWVPTEIALAQEAAIRIWEAIERARAETALRTSEARHRAMFDAIDEGACLFKRLPVRADGRRDYRCVAMNPAMQKMFGVPNLSGQPIRDNFPAEVETWYDDYDRVLDTGLPLRVVRESIPQRKVLDVFLTRVEDATGQMLLAVMQDVTVRVRAEEILRQEEARQSFLLRFSDTLKGMSDSEEVLTTATRICGEHLGVAIASFAEIETIDGLKYYVIHGSYAAPGQPSVDGRYLYSDFPGIADMLLTGRTSVVRDVTNDAMLSDRDKAAYAAADVASFMATPLVRDGRLIAVFAVREPRPREWKALEVSLLEHVAERIWGALFSARMEAALRKSEERFRALVSSTSYAIYRMSPDWREMWELDGNGFLGDTTGPSSNWLEDYIDPVDQPEVLAAIDAAIDQKHVFEFEHRVKRPDGTFGWTLSRAVPLMNSKGEVIEWFGAASDVTARRLAEEASREAELRLRLAQEAAGVGTFDWIVEGNHGHWSPQLLGMLGIREGQFGGRYEDWIDMIHSEDRERAAQSITSALEYGSLQEEWRVLRADGEILWMLVRGIVERDANGRPVRLIGAQMDITEKVHMEQNVKYLLADLDCQIHDLKRRLDRSDD